MTQFHYEDQTDPPPRPEAPAEAAGEGLSEAQIVAIENAFAEHNRVLARLRRELDDLRLRPEEPLAADPGVETIGDRLDAIEARLDHQDQALRHVLQRLIAFFEREGPERA